MKKFRAPCPPDLAINFHFDSAGYEVDFVLRGRHEAHFLRDWTSMTNKKRKILAEYLGARLFRYLEKLMLKIR